jgi:hypothetical protein
MVLGDGIRRNIAHSVGTGARPPARRPRIQAPIQILLKPKPKQRS